MKVVNAYYRVHQFIFSKAIKLIRWRVPSVITGAGSVMKLPAQMKDDRVTKLLLITTSGTIRRGGLAPLLAELGKEQIAHVIYDQVQPDPTIVCIEEAVIIFQKERCDAILAVGGGSVLDCAKIVGARAVKPNQSVKKMTGMFKIHKKLPLLYAVPTTAGTGSEVTVAAVITDSVSHYKYPISDLCLVPAYAVLDPELTCDMPQHLTATTGMDALTHAVEAYTNKYSSKQSKECAREAVKLIFGNLTRAFENGSDVAVREHMLIASYYAGTAFTKAYVGYVHAIAHALGGLYGVAHGYANAVILPVVLESYGEGVYPQLAELADAVGIRGTSKQEKAKKFIQAIRRMNRQMGIPTKLHVIQQEDQKEIIKRAQKEANPTYPVPVIWNKKQMKKVLEQL
jgi:alcohol dehydrogenase class IV